MRKNICHIFILFAFLTGIIAPSCGFAWNGKYSIIEICGAQGTKQKVVSNQDLPPSEHIPTAQNECQFCFQNSHVLANFVPSQTLNHSSVAIIQNIIARHNILYRQILSQYHTARGPPSFV